jgi:16S rRNA (guanine527-N7)-methyltransferase
MSVVAPPETLPPLPGRFLEAIGATPEREADVEAFRQRLAAANASMNLVGASTLGEFWRRHFVDSAQLLWFAPGVRVWADLGSGAGLPGLVLAILLKGRPGARVHLVESMAKRCRFLSEVVEALGLPAVVHHARAETLTLKVERVTARACAPLERLLAYAEPFFARGATGLFLKGAEVDQEIADARRAWRFKADTLVSLSDPRGRLLSIEELGRVPRR